MKTITPTTAQLRMLASIKSQQWLIQPEAMQDYAMAALELTGRCDSDSSDDFLDQFYTRRVAMFLDGDGIAHIQVVGSLLNKAPAIYEKWSLATRYDTIIAETQAAVEQGAKGILYHFDSPGGTVAGIIEASEAIADAGVPTVAHCHGLACSAAYWLPAGMSAIIASPSATVGNIGAIITWMDCTGFWAEQGIVFKALTSEGADLKSTFHLEPNDEQLAFLQDSINEAGAAFRAHVAAGRAAAGATLDDEVFRAGWYSGQRAGQLGLIDAIGTAENARQVLIEAIS
jgi:ClpP class serine protease